MKIAVFLVGLFGWALSQHWDHSEGFGNENLSGSILPRDGPEDDGSYRAEHHNGPWNNGQSEGGYDDGSYRPEHHGDSSENKDYSGSRSGNYDSYRPARSGSWNSERSKSSSDDDDGSYMPRYDGNSWSSGRAARSPLDDGSYTPESSGSWNNDPSHKSPVDDFSSPWNYNDHSASSRADDGSYRPEHHRGSWNNYAHPGNGAGDDGSYRHEHHRRPADNGFYRSEHHVPHKKWSGPIAVSPGYHKNGAPLPVLDTPEVAAVKSKHFRLFSHGAYAAAVPGAQVLPYNRPDATKFSSWHP